MTNPLKPNSSLFANPPSFTWYFHGSYRRWADSPQRQNKHAHHATETVLRQWLPSSLCPCTTWSEPFLSVTITPSAPYQISSSTITQHRVRLAGLVSGPLLKASSPPPAPGSHSCLSPMPGAPTPHLFLISYISQYLPLFLEPGGAFPSSELLLCAVQMRIREEKLAAGLIS